MATVTSVAWTTLPAEGETLVAAAGDALALAVTFSADVTLAAGAALVLRIGGDLREATIPAGSGPATVLVAEYVVEPGLYTEEGVSVEANLRLGDGGTLSWPGLAAEPRVQVNSAEGLRHVVLRGQLAAGRPVLSVDRLRRHVVVGEADPAAARGEALQVFGDVYASGDVLAVSDARMKEDVREIADAVAKLRGVRGVTFRRRDGGEKRHAGLLAQELEAVLPEAVVTDDVGMKAVAYGNVVSILVQAVRELSARLEALEGSS